MAQKRRRNWKQLAAYNMRHAMELCVQHAQQELNRSVEQIAELMGEASHNTLYKWLATGRMPAIQIRSLEGACGTDFVTRYLAHSANQLLVKMPTGKKAQHRELSELNIAANNVINQLYQFYDGDTEVEQTINQITVLIEDLAHHRGNVAKFQQPDLTLLEADE